MNEEGSDSGKDMRLSPFAPRPLTEGEDFYREGPAIVFTALYHLRRGYCCGSGCRHCPYGDDAAEGGRSGGGFPK